MRERQQAFAGSPWEAKVGFSRATRVGDHVTVAGTVAVGPDGTVVAPGDAYGQTKAIIGIIERALADVGASLSDVVRTRSFITELDQWEAFAQAHAETFADIQPVATLVQVAGLLGEGTVIEIEADAIVATGA